MKHSFAPRLDSGAAIATDLQPVPKTQYNPPIIHIYIPHIHLSDTPPHTSQHTTTYHCARLRYAYFSAYLLYRHTPPHTPHHPTHHHTQHTIHNTPTHTTTSHHITPHNTTHRHTPPHTTTHHLTPPHHHTHSTQYTTHHHTLPHHTT